jgi:hypothetical protein
MLAQSNPVVVTTVLAAAGWHHITVEPVTLSMRLGDNAQEATECLASPGIARSVLDTIDADEHWRSPSPRPPVAAARVGSAGLLPGTGAVVDEDGGLTVLEAWPAAVGTELGCLPNPSNR